MKTVLFFISLDRSCFKKQLEGIYRFSRDRDWHVQVIERGLRSKELKKALEFWKPIGVFVEYGKSTKIDFTAFGDIPVVCIDIGRQVPNPRINVVGLDSAAVGRFGARYLLSLKFVSSGYVGYWESMPWDHERRSGFVDEVCAAGGDCRTFAPRKRLSPPERNRRLHQWLSTLPKPCGIMACNDSVGEEVLNACSSLGVRVPEEVAVIGVDNDFTLCENAVPSLTSIDPDNTQSGYLAAEMLERIISSGGNGAPCRCYYPPLRVVTRHSTRKISCDRSAVGKALEFIRRHACEGVGVAEVVSVMGVSRRAAENHFRLATGRSILEEIDDVRFTKVFELLGDNRQMISSIADFSGFSTEVALRKAFRKRTGMSMSAWRKKSAAETCD